MTWFDKIISFVSGLFTTSTLDRFLKDYITLARQVVGELAEVNSGQEFHAWKDQAWLRLKNETREVKDNWISILLGLAYETLKRR